MMKHYLLLSLAFAPLFTEAGPPPRIVQKTLNRSCVEPLYMTLGKATLIELPYEITSIVIGNALGLRYEEPKGLKKNQTVLHLKTTAIKMNHLILTTTGDKVFIFDIFASSDHQDYLKVTSDYEAQSEETLLKSSRVIP